MIPRVAVLVLLVVSVLGCAAHRPQAARPAAAPPAKGLPLAVYVTDAGTGLPMGGVSLAVAAVTPAQIDPVYEPAGVTNARGEGTVRVNPDAASSFTVKASKVSYATAGAFIDSVEDAAPAAPVLFRLEHGVRMGGVVRNERGEPVQGAAVCVEVLADESGGAAMLPMDEVVATSGRDGRWSFDGFPPHAEHVAPIVSHSDYVGPFAGVPDAGWASIDALRRGEAVTVLKRGTPLGGFVRDDTGRPIPSARVTMGWGAMIGGPPAAMTDASGAFRFEHIGEVETVLTAQAPSRAPGVVQLVVRRDLPPVEFRLGPGRVLRGRVVGKGGKAVAGADVIATKWRDRQNLRWRTRTDADGRFFGDDLPPDAVTYYVDARGWMPREVTLTAHADVGGGAGSGAAPGAEQTVELDPPLRVAGSITDAETGAPVEPVAILSGFDPGDGVGTRWENARRSTATGGRYRQTLRGAMAGSQLRFEAEGFLPELSRTFKPDEGSVTLDVKLRRPRGHAVVLADADGRPAGGVDVVAVAAGQDQVLIREGHIEAYNGQQLPSKSRADGTVDISLPAGDYVLVAAGEQGYVAVPSTQVPAKGDAKLTLKRWSQVTGHSLSRGKPAPGQAVTYKTYRVIKSGALAITATVDATAVSDEQGRFELKHCVAGPATAGRIVMSTERPMMVPEDLATLDVLPYPQVTDVTLGAGGRTVTAKVIAPDDFAGDWAAGLGCMALLRPVPPQLPLPKNWLTMKEPQREQWMEQFKRTDAGRDWARQAPAALMIRMLVVNRNGTVRADDVSPGSYLLTVQTNEPRWASVGHEFTVPEAAAGQDPEPIDLGNLELLPRSWPKSGTTQPAEAP